MNTARSGRSVVLTAGLFTILIAAAIPAANGDNKAMTTETRVPRKVMAPTQMKSSEPSVEDARQFVEGAENRLLTLWIAAQRSAWVQETFITPDTEEIAAEADQAVKAATAELAAQARRYEGLKLPEDVARKLKLIKLSVDIPAPRETAESTELSQINASLQSDYGKGKWCPDGPQGKCLSLNDIEHVMATSRDPKELQRAWEGWHTIAPPMRKRYTRMVVLADKGAREMGFADVGAMWRSNYDMAPDAFSAELDRLWQQVRPLYISLHAYVRWNLEKKYGSGVVSEDRPIPAHLLGNVWSQDWTNIYPLIAPANADPGYDLTEILKAKQIDPVGMVQYGERFFMSLGFAALPQTFWERSMFTKPRDRDVVCHASAWDVDYVEDLRIKMCIEQKSEHFTTIHHELGHNFYQRAYDTQPPLFRNSANDGFHEAIGDTIALSVTPEYLRQIGLLENVPPASSDIGLLMKRALDKVAFLPFGLLIDKWRWEVLFRGSNAGELQQGLVGTAREISGHRAAVATQRRGFRSGREVSRRSERPLRPLFPCRNPAISVSPRAMPRSRLSRPAASLLDLQQ